MNIGMSDLNLQFSSFTERVVGGGGGGCCILMVMQTIYKRKPEGLKVYYPKLGQTFNRVTLFFCTIFESFNILLDAGL